MYLILWYEDSDLVETLIDSEGGDERRDGGGGGEGDGERDGRDDKEAGWRGDVCMRCT